MRSLSMHDVVLHAYCIEFSLICTLLRRHLCALQRPLNFFEKLVSRRKLNIELASLLSDRILGLDNGEDTSATSAAVIAWKPGVGSGVGRASSEEPTSHDGGNSAGHDSCVPFGMDGDVDEISAVDIAVAAMTALSPDPVTPLAMVESLHHTAAGTRKATAPASSYRSGGETVKPSAIAPAPAGGFPWPDDASKAREGSSSAALMLGSFPVSV